MAIEDLQIDPSNREKLASAVRLSLDWFAGQHPGHAVELRVPPFRVVQVMGGTRHKRGTPPAVVEMSSESWLLLITGQVGWDTLVTTGQIVASGERSNLSACFTDEAILNVNV